MVGRCGGERHEKWHEGVAAAGDVGLQDLTLILLHGVLGLEHTTFDLVQVDKVRRFYTGFYSDLDQLRRLEEAAGIIQ